MKRKNSVGQQFHRCQQNQQTPLSSELIEHTKRPVHVTEIQVLD